MHRVSQYPPMETLHRAQLMKPLSGVTPWNPGSRFFGAISRPIFVGHKIDTFFPLTVHNMRTIMIFVIR